MSKKVFCTISSHSVGVTFLDWSIHYLNNQDKFFNTNLQWIDLVDNPLTNLNSHGHSKNHPSGFRRSKNIVQLFNDESDGLFSFYPHPLHLDNAATELDIPIELLGQKDKYSSIVEYQTKDFSALWDLCHENNIQLKYLLLTNDPLYLLSRRVLERKLASPDSYSNSNEFLEEYIEIFFKDSASQFFKNKNFSSWTKWDLREFLSLNIRPYEILNSIEKDLDLNKPHFYLNTKEWWLAGDCVIIDIMNYLNLSINKDRFSKWIDIYKSWQQIQIQILKFQWNFDHICDSIVNNKFYSIKEYNLSLLQEAAIQHAMLYKYGLNFKIHGLEKFPNNTRDLHGLLESNFDHNIEDIYGCLK